MEMETKLQKARLLPPLFNSHEKLFNLRRSTKYAKEIAQLSKNFDTYLHLWTSIHDFQKSYVSWMHGPFSELDGEKVEGDVNRWWGLIQKLQRTVKALPAPTNALNDFKKKVYHVVLYIDK